MHVQETRHTIRYHIQYWSRTAHQVLHRAYIVLHTDRSGVAGTSPSKDKLVLHMDRSGVAGTCHLPGTRCRGLWEDKVQHARRQLNLTPLFLHLETLGRSLWVGERTWNGCNAMNNSSFPWSWNSSQIKGREEVEKIETNGWSFKEERGTDDKFQGQERMQVWSLEGQERMKKSVEVWADDKRALQIRQANKHAWRNLSQVPQLAQHWRNVSLAFLLSELLQKSAGVCVLQRKQEWTLQNERWVFKNREKLLQRTYI